MSRPRRFGKSFAAKMLAAYPALVVELKYTGSAEGAIAQIKARRYPDALAGFDGEVLLVGISYDREVAPGGRAHSCVIERARRA